MAQPNDSTPATITERGPEAAAAVRRAWDQGRPLMVVPPTECEVPRLGDLAPGTATVVATSGTTATPRLVAHTRAAVEASCRAVSAALAIDPERDRWLACVPLHHVAGLAIVLRAAITGTEVTIHAGFDVDAVSRAAGECTVVSLVPTQLGRLLDAGAPLDRFRAVLLGGGPIPPAVSRRAIEAGVSVHTTYGLTETFGGCVHDGVALPGVEVALDDASNEVLVRGPMVMAGYVGDAAESRQALRADGWLATGDVGAIDAAGRLSIVDRLKDLIITGGVNVSPTAVERVVLDHPRVADACVIGVPDAEWGERVVAYVVPELRGGVQLTVEELRDFARERLTRAELPREVRVVDGIPRTASGKPLRRALSDALNP